jgi:hypothetical protein
MTERIVERVGVILAHVIGEQRRSRIRTGVA